MRGTLSIRNRQRVRRIDTAQLRRIAVCLLHEHLRIGSFDLCLHMVAAPEMARLNGTFLQHEGSTDVITFDYSSEELPSPPGMPQVEDGRQQEISGPDRPLRGELFICVDDAVAHARQFRTTWQSELVRYVIHGLLHLCGHDDLQPAARHKMKQEERRLLRQLSQRFPLARLGKPHRSDC